MSSEAQINSALLEAFDESDLARLVRFIFDTNISAIAGGVDLTAVVFNLVRWAFQTNNIERLIAGAIEQNPDNEGLRGLTVSNGTYKGDAPVSLELISYRLSRLEEAIERLYAITVGVNGDNGLRSVVDELAAAYDSLLLGDDGIHRKSPTRTIGSRRGKVVMALLIAVLILSNIFVIAAAVAGLI